VDNDGSYRLQERQDFNAKEREKEEDQMFKEVFDGLSCSHGITEEASETVNTAQKIKREKQWTLHAHWSAAVYQKIQRRIRVELNKQTTFQIESRWRKSFQEYLNAANSKTALFRDVIIEADYDPMKHTRTNIRVRIGDVKDPLKVDVLKPMREAALVRISLMWYGTCRKET
jgi:polyribonucleotide nucleotidyltransferase